jgi:hypothetical protein
MRMYMILATGSVVDQRMHNIYIYVNVATFVNKLRNTGSRVYYSPICLIILRTETVRNGLRRLLYHLFEKLFAIYI